VKLLTVFVQILLVVNVEGRGRAGGGFRGGGFRGGGSSSRSGGFFSSGSRTTSSKTGWGWGGPRTSSSYSRYNSYSGGYGRSTSSGGFGLGLGSGLLLGYSLSRPGIGYGYGWGHGHSNYQYHRAGRYDTTRPISCYTGSLTAEIKGDVSLDESLKTCAMYEDVCFGKVILTVSNDTQNSVGYVQAMLKLCKYIRVGEQSPETEEM